MNLCCRPSEIILHSVFLYVCCCCKQYLQYRALLTDDAEPICPGVRMLPWSIAFSALLTTAIRSGLLICTCTNCSLLDMSTCLNSIFAKFVDCLQTSCTLLLLFPGRWSSSVSAPFRVHQEVYTFASFCSDVFLRLLQNARLLSLIHPGNLSIYVPFHHILIRN